MSLATASILIELILIAVLLVAREVWRRRSARAASAGRNDTADPSSMPLSPYREPGDLLPALFVDTCADWAVRDEADAATRPAPAPLVLDTSWRLVLPPDDEPDPAPVSAPASSRPTTLSCTIARSAQERA